MRRWGLWTSQFKRRKHKTHVQWAWPWCLCCCPGKFPYLVCQPGNKQKWLRGRIPWVSLPSFNLIIFYGWKSHPINEGCMRSSSSIMGSLRTSGFLAYLYVVAISPGLHLPRKTFTLVLTDGRKGKTLFSLILFVFSLSLSPLLFPRVKKRKEGIWEMASN